MEPMASCSECEHHDYWAGEEVCSMLETGKADADQDHYLVRKAFNRDDPSICPTGKRRLNGNS